MLAVVLAILLHSLVGVVYSRFVYYLVVGPIFGVLLFPMAWAANRWLTPMLSSWMRRT